MNPISKCLDEIRFRIPKQILDVVFLQRDYRWRSTPTSLDDHILNEVLRPRVFVDCNLVGGTETYIPLHDVPVERENEYVCIYRIPKSKTQGRSILSVLNITYTDPSRVQSYGVASAVGNSTMLQAGQAAMNAMGAIPMTSTARVQLIGENVVMVRDTVMLPPNVHLRCVLANDETISHLQLRSYRAFSTLCVLAVKAFIYNTYAIQMDMGQLAGGQQLGKFKEIIDGYADAEELYQTYITEKWEKISMMNDQTQYERHIKRMIGGYR